VRGVLRGVPGEDQHPGDVDHDEGGSENGGEDAVVREVYFPAVDHGAGEQAGLPAGAETAEICDAEVAEVEGGVDNEDAGAGEGVDGSAGFPGAAGEDVSAVVRHAQAEQVRFT